MFTLFSTREVVTGIYLILFLVFLISKKPTRDSVIGLIRAACKKNLVIPCIVLISYSCILTYMFSRISILKNIYIKDIAIWTIFAGVPMCFNAVSMNAESHYFRNIIIDNIKLTALVEFLSGTFTFSFVIELIIQPIITFFVVLQAFSETRDEYKPLRNPLSWIVSIIGFIILICTIKAAIGMYPNLNAIDMLVSFLIPPIFSILFIPMAYLLALYAKYEIIFIRMGLKEPSDKHLRTKHRLTVIRVCKLSFKKAYRFEKECVPKMYSSQSKDKFDELISAFVSVKTK